MVRINLHDWHIFLNPSSGSGRGGTSWKKVSESFNEYGLQFTADESEYPGHIDLQLATGLKSGKRKFISYGGDGTLNALVNAVMKQDAVSYTHLTLPTKA